MKIAVIGWGSLIWDKRELFIVGDWKAGGPILRIEFSRISADGRLTLVIDQHNGTNVTSLFARSGFENLDDAIANLREREGSPPKERIGFVNLVNNTERDFLRQQYPGASDAIKAWAQANDWQAVIWTALSSNFMERRRTPFSVAAAVTYVNSLVEEQKSKAFEYVRKAPAEVDTPVRRAIQAIEYKNTAKKGGQDGKDNNQHKEASQSVQCSGQSWSWPRSR